MSQGPAYTAATQRLGGVGDRGPQRFGKVGHPLDCRDAEVPTPEERPYIILPVPRPRDAETEAFRGGV